MCSGRSILGRSDRIGSVVIALALALGFAGCGDSTPSNSSARANIVPWPHHGAALNPQGQHSKRPRSAEADLALREALGQRFVAGFKGPVAPPPLLAAIRQGQLGGVILFSNNTLDIPRTRRLTARLQQAAREGDQPRLLIMVDQEGGTVKRLPFAPPTLSARQMGQSGSPAGVASVQARATGQALQHLGINVDLAPVADVAASGSFIGSRSFGEDTGNVTQATCAFADGLRRSHVVPVLKHFPGLGRAAASTDVVPVTIGATSGAINRDLAPYRRCGRRTPMVMMSSASYAALASAEPAVMTPAAYRLLRRTGFRGVTVSDAFDTPAIASRQGPALRSLKAGLDIVLYTQDYTGALNAYARIAAQLRSGALSAPSVRAHAAKILRLKRALTDGP